MQMEFSAGGIVYKVDKQGQVQIALVLTLDKEWGFPKGHIEKGEKPEEAAIREVGEEIGVTDLKIITLLKKIDYWFKFNNELIHKYVYFYLMEAPTEAELVHQKEELEDARWFPAEEALKEVGYKKDNVPILKLAFEKLGGRDLD